MPTLNVSASWSTKLRAVAFRDDGDFDLVFVFLNAANVAVRTHTYTLRVDGSGVYEGGNQIRNSGPANLLGDMVEVANHFDAMLSNAIAAGNVTP
jgi:hypothetical protein